MQTVFQQGSNYKKFSMPELWLLQNAKMLGLFYICFLKDLSLKGLNQADRINW